MPGDPWKKRKSVRICAAIDMIFALLLIAVYGYRLSFDIRQGDDDLNPRRFFRSGERIGITVLLWVVAFSINVIQLIIAYSLFTAVKMGCNDSDASIPRAKYWLIISNAIFVMLISKFIFFVFFDKANDSGIKILMLIVCIGELLFKAYAMYFVKEFLDDLKSSYAAPAARVQFISLLKSPNQKDQRLNQNASDV